MALHSPNWLEGDARTDGALVVGQTRDNRKKDLGEESGEDVRERLVEQRPSLDVG